VAEATFGPGDRRVIRCVADNVEDAIIPDCGHWITEEQPQATTDLVADFLRRARLKTVPAFEPTLGQVELRRRRRLGPRRRRHRGHADRTGPVDTAKDVLQYGSKLAVSATASASQPVADTRDRTSATTGAI